MTHLNIDDVIHMMASAPKPAPLPFMIVNSDRDRLLLERLRVPTELLRVSEHVTPGFLYMVDREILKRQATLMSPWIERVERKTLDLISKMAKMRRKHVRRLRSSPRGRRISGWVYL